MALLPVADCEPADGIASLTPNRRTERQGRPAAERNRKASGLAFNGRLYAGATRISHDRRREFRFCLEVHESGLVFRREQEEIGAGVQRAGASFPAPRASRLPNGGVAHGAGCAAPLSVPGQSSGLPSVGGPQSPVWPLAWQSRNQATHAWIVSSGKRHL